MDLLDIAEKGGKIHKHFLDDGSEDENPRDSLLDGNCIQYRVTNTQNESPLSYRVVTSDSQGDSNSSSAINPLSNVQAVLASPLNGQFYVIGNPSDILGSSTGQRTIAPRAVVSHVDSPNTSLHTSKDDKQGTRRATHNEVERRRRDNINSWIVKLGKLIPDSGGDSGQGGKHTQSKGGILAKACQYLSDLRNQSSRLNDDAKETENLLQENERLTSLVDQLQQENSLLKQQLENHGILPQTADIKFSL